MLALPFAFTVLCYTAHHMLPESVNSYSADTKINAPVSQKSQCTGDVKVLIATSFLRSRHVATGVLPQTFAIGPT